MLNITDAKSRLVLLVILMPALFALNEGGFRVVKVSQDTANGDTKPKHKYQKTERVYG